MKRILCYGDSNTWGHTPGTGARYPEGVRWTSILSQKLSDTCVVLEDGINGRTTVFDDYYLPCRNGKSGLGYALLAHKPLDVLVLSLGTNDLKYVGALASSKGVDQLLRLCSQASACFDNGSSPVFAPDAKILVVSPIRLHPEIAQRNPTSSIAAKYEESIRFSACFREVARKWGAEFLDAAQVAEPSIADCIHMDASSHARLAEAIAQKLRRMLDLDAPAESV